MPQFERYIGIDYSRAETADSICNGFLAYIAECNGTPKQFEPPPYSVKEVLGRRRRLTVVIHGQADVLPPPVSFPVSECLYSPAKQPSRRRSTNSVRSRKSAVMVWAVQSIREQAQFCLPC